MALSRKKPYRFNEMSDVKLLREVLAQNPFQDQKKWSSIADALRGDSDIQIDGRRARERTSLLTLKFKKEEGGFRLRWRYGRNKYYGTIFFLHYVKYISRLKVL